MKKITEEQKAALRAFAVHSDALWSAFDPEGATHDTMQTIAADEKRSSARLLDIMGNDLQSLSRLVKTMED